MKTMALSGVFVLASAGLALAAAEALVKPDTPLPLTAVEEAAIIAKKTGAPEAEPVSVICDAAGQAPPPCAEAEAKD